MTKSLMIQGTSSGVGKSILSIGLCRILLQDGFRVAPFKPQNMSGNACVLKNGLEMAQMQAIAARACGIEPSVDMNPVLLKPFDGGTDVIVQGRSVGWMDRDRYKEYKKHDAWIPVLDSFRRLKREHEIIVLEGAGSPVELNMKDDDIGNMNMAREADAPVILVTDIERGGAFAKIHGTLALFSGGERRRVKGVIVNKCRGRLDLFDEVRKTMEDMTGLPVLGMIPYMDIDIEDEDGLFDSATGLKKTGKNRPIEVLQRQFDRLAESLRKHVDMPRVYEIMKNGGNFALRSEA